MRALTILTSAVAVVAASLGVVAASGPAGAAPEDVVLKGHVVDSSGNPLQGIAVHCDIDYDIDFEPDSFVVTGTDSDGNYSFTRKELDDANVSAADRAYTGCKHLWFFDPEGRYTTTAWPSADGTYTGDPLPVPSSEGADPAVADGTLGAAGQLAGSATDVKNRGLYDVKVEALSAATRKVVLSVQTTPYGGFRFLGLRPGKYKVKIGTGVTDIGYRPAYAGGGSTFDSAKTFTVKAGESTAVGRQSLPNTKRLFTSRGKPVLEYDRPLLPGTQFGLSKSAYTASPDSWTLRFDLASRALDPRTGEPDDTLPYASATWDYYEGEHDSSLPRLGDFPVVGRRFVLVVVHSRRGFATTFAVSDPTAIVQAAPPAE